MQNRFIKKSVNSVLTDFYPYTSLTHLPFLTSLLFIIRIEKNELTLTLVESSIDAIFKEESMYLSASVPF